MMMLIQRICMAFSGLGKFISVAKEMSVSAAMLLQASRGVYQNTFCFTVNITSVVTLTCSAGSEQSF